MYGHDHCCRLIYLRSICLEMLVVTCDYFHDDRMALGNQCSVQCLF